MFPPCETPRGAADHTCRVLITEAARPALLAIALFCLCANALTAQLPHDESDLAALLEEQAIDTFQYEQLLVFYALPLSVPQGELALLARVFPEIEELLPSRERLEEYEPFDNRQVRQLFCDFPALADFEPVLRFNAAPPAQPTNGEIIFGINKSDISRLKGQRARFRQKSRTVSTEGAIALSDSGALWQSRRVDLSYGSASAHIGNFRQPLPGELSFGKFAPLTDEDTSIISNWLYATSNTWNGLSIEAKSIPGLRMMGADAFCHIRPGERGGGGGVRICTGKQWEFYAGFTGFEIGRRDNPTNVNDIDEPDYNEDADGPANPNAAGPDSSGGLDYIHTAHLYGEYRGKVWRASAEAALPLNDESRVPALALRLGYRIKNSHAEYHTLYYPQNFSAPLSGMKRRTLAEAGVKEAPGSSQSPSVQKHGLRMTVPLVEKAPPPKKKKSPAPAKKTSAKSVKDTVILTINDTVATRIKEAAAVKADVMAIPFIDMARLIPEIDFTENDGAVRRIYGRATLRARSGRADIALTHSSKIFTAETDSALHTSGASLNLQTAWPLDVRTSYRRIYGYYKNARSYYSLELPCAALPNTIITPFITSKYIMDNEYKIGLKTELHLYKKTWTFITIEIPIGVKGDDNVYIKGSSSYAF